MQPRPTENFEALAAAFVRQPDRGTDIAAADLLSRDALDYSVESLRAVDQYLAKLSAMDETQFCDEEYGNAVIRAAAYAGEVVRRNARRQYSWMTYEEFGARFPALVSRVEEKETTRWLLAEPNGSVLLPLERVMQRLTTGGGGLHAFFGFLLQQGI